MKPVINTVTGGCITDLLRQQAAMFPDKVALVQGSHTYTYSSLLAEANRVAHWLKDHGVQPGDRVVLYGSNSTRFVAALFGALAVGAAFVPIHPKIREAKLEYILRDCAPVALVIDPELLELCNGLLPRPLPVILLTADSTSISTPAASAASGWNHLACYSLNEPEVAISLDALASIIYTSGSTRDPRGVMLPHRQVIFATSAINTVVGNTSEDVVLCGLPLSFDYGLYQIFLMFQVGAKIILERDFSIPMSIPRLLAHHEITGLPVVPSLIALLLRSRLLERTPLPHLRYITSTGDVFPSAHIRRLRELLPQVTVFPMYGLTECKRVSIVPPGHLDGHESSVGLPLPNTTVAVLDDAGQEVKPGVVGELVVRGSHVMAGYWQAPEDTARRFRRDPSTGEVVLYTGDFFSRDSDGFLYFAGRKELFIKSRGEKVSPAEIESFLCSIDGVTEAAAIGIADSIVGEAVCVFISVVTVSMIDTEIIREQCRHKLAPSSQPDHIFIFDQLLPRTTNGKIDRRQLKNLATERAWGGGDV